MSYTIQQNNVLDWARDYDGPPFHAMLCDPPYHLTDQRDPRRGFPARDGKQGEWDDAGRVRMQGGRGFMNAKWDGGDVAYRPETWAALAAHLYPGAFGMAFASTRGLHRMMVAIEDAGLILQPTIFLYAFGSGFPKATRIDTQADRLAGAERRKVGTKRQIGAKFKLTQETIDNGGFNDPSRQSFDVTAPTTDLARAWEGHRYGGQALKPSVEPIIVFQRPYEGRPVECITRTGAGALWIDGGRVGTDDDTGRTTGHLFGGMENPGGIIGGVTVAHPSGRWPANLILQHTDRCERIGVRRVRGGNGVRGSDDGSTIYGRGKGLQHRVTGQQVGYADADGYETVDDYRCVPECPVARLGAQSGELTSGANKAGSLQGRGTNGVYGDYDGFAGQEYMANTGTAARFFFQADYALERLADADPLYYCAKASRAEREAGLDPRTMAFMRAIEGEDGDDDGEFEEGRKNRVYAQGNGFKGRTFKDGQWVNVEYPETTIDDGRPTPIDNPYQRGETKRRNPHPTVKPLSLARYLATLLLPPDRYAPRRLLVPFAGVASEMIGAMLAGWEEVLGIELDDDGTHIPVAEARIAYWLQRRAELSDPSKPITVNIAAVQDGQLDMFGGGE